MFISNSFAVKIKSSTMCDSRKYPYSPHRRDWKFRGGGGIWKSQKFKAMYEAKLEFPEGWGGHTANPFYEGVWIFSGTTRSSIAATE